MPDLPSTMRAIDPAAKGGPETLRVVELPVPMPQPGEVLIRVAVAGVNRPDVQQRLGLYPPPPGASLILGLEVAGTVVATGGETRWQVGDEVCALVSGGGYAEHVAVAAGQCLPVPAGLSLADAAGLPETYFTVWTNLFHRGRAAAGESLLVHGGTSGIGTTAIQLAKAFGLTVFTTAGSADKCAAARALGADIAIDYRSEDFVQVVKGATGGRGVDIVLDIVGGDYFRRNLDCLAEEGRHISIAMQKGAEVPLFIPALMRKRLTLTGSMLRPRDAAFKALIAQALEEKVWPLFAAGTLRPVSDSTFPLEQAAAAHRRMDAGEHIGKILLAVS